MPDGDRPAGIGADKLNLSRLANADIEPGEIFASGDNRIDLAPEKVARQEAVDKAGRRDFDRLSEFKMGQPGRDHIGDFERAHAGCLGQCHRRIRKIALACPLRRARRNARYSEGRQIAAGLGPGQSLLDCVFEFPVELVQALLSCA